MVRLRLNGEGANPNRYINSPPVRMCNQQPLIIDFGFLCPTYRLQKCTFLVLTVFLANSFVLEITLFTDSLRPVSDPISR